MHVGVLPLLGSLAMGGPPAAPALPAGPAPYCPPGLTAPAGPYPGGPVYPGSPRGILPVPGMGPPGAVAGVGGLPVPPTPPTQAICPPGPPAPLVAARFLAPPGVRVTAFPGSALSRILDTPSVVGLRPGYVYRFELSGLPFNPGKALYPEVEVRGVLAPRAGMRYMDHPIPLAFSQEDLERALAGVLVTKVVYLEDPEKAIPAATRADLPIEVNDDSEAAAVRAAKENGRLMAVIRIGDRRPSAAELQTAAVDGTVLLPGERTLKAPVLPPVFPFWAVPFYDPLLGPRVPSEECFPNGADRKDPLGIGPGDRLGGLNPTDVGVEYTVGGKRRVTTTGAVCICAPRFITRRAELIPAGFELRQVLATHTGREVPGWVRERVAPMADVGREKANETVGRTRPSGYVGRVGLSFFVGTSRPAVFGQVEGVKVEGALVEPEQLTAYPTLAPLTVTKTVDPSGPRQSGDVVTITIRYANTGPKAISDVVVSDSLSGRLEYVPGSAQADRPANFTAAANEAGSVIVRWELPGTLLPGQSGTIKFKAKVR